MMKITYDKDADAAYVQLVKSIMPGEAEKTLQVNDEIMLDYDKEGKLLGIEVLSASKILGNRVLEDATAV